MKKINILLCLFSLVLGFTACENDEDKMYVLPAEKVTAPVLSLEGSDEIVVTEDTYQWFFSTLNWSQVSFGEDVLVQYSVEITDGEKTLDPEVIGNELSSKTLLGSELSKWILKGLGTGYDSESKEEFPVDISMRIIATPTLENPEVTIPPGKVYSNWVNMTVTPHYVVEIPDNIYMIGSEFGDWNWDSDGVAEMIPVNGNPGHFWCIRYFTAGEGFKWNTIRDWGGDFNELTNEAGDVSWYTNEGNAFVNNSGLYMVYIDWNEETISIETAKVYGMGPAFGDSWEMGANPFTIDGRLMKASVPASSELRMYANSDISPIGGDWWRMEFVLRGGIIEYRGNGGDQEPRVPTAAGEVILDFNTGTGTNK